MDKRYILTLPKKTDDMLTWCEVECGIGRDEVYQRAFALFVAALKADEVQFIKDGAVQKVKVK